MQIYLSVTYEWTAKEIDCLLDLLDIARQNMRDIREATIREAAKVSLTVAPCPFDSKTGLQPEDPCPVCGDTGEYIKGKTSNCRSPAQSGHTVADGEGTMGLRPLLKAPKAGANPARSITASTK